MVVMDRIDGKDMFGCRIMEGDLRRDLEAKALLHQHEFVFGDLRPNNIVKPANGSGVTLIGVPLLTRIQSTVTPVVVGIETWVVR
jgi:tRNA A-37 threonylcarbamoyl transferase component Bud32